MKLIKLVWMPKSLCCWITGKGSGVSSLPVGEERSRLFLVACLLLSSALERLRMSRGHGAVVAKLPASDSSSVSFIARADVG